MHKIKFFNLLFLNLLLLASCKANDGEAEEPSTKTEAPVEAKITTGAAQTQLYLPLLKGKNVAVVANPTSVIGDVHLVDTLMRLGINVQRVFAPEHGFRGKHDAGANIAHGRDAQTGIELFSLHGSTKKPSAKSLQDIDVVLFDIQDVGLRFYTYISTLHYVMEACAENGKELIVLDRPNPNAYYTAGPILEDKYRSFVGMHPVPVVYGLSIGEYAQMINGEYWLKDSLQSNLTVIPLKNWKRSMLYELPIPPSPNLPNTLSVLLYPSLCFLEGTVMNEGRGTAFPFQVYGHPAYQDTSFAYTPKSIKGKSAHPKFKNQQCYGNDLRTLSIAEVRSWKKLNLDFLQDAYEQTPVEDFFNRPSFFNLLEGQNHLMKAIQNKQLEELQHQWQKEMKAYLKMSAQYKMYD